MHESITTLQAIIVNTFFDDLHKLLHFYYRQSPSVKRQRTNGSYWSKSQMPVEYSRHRKNATRIQKRHLTHASFCKASWRLPTPTYKSFDKSSDIIRSRWRSVCEKSSLRRLRASATQIFHLSREVGAWLRNGYLEISHLVNAICGLFKVEKYRANCEICCSWFCGRAAVWPVWFMVKWK